MQTFFRFLAHELFLWINGIVVAVGIFLAGTVGGGNVFLVSFAFYIVLALFVQTFVLTMSGEKRGKLIKVYKMKRSSLFILFCSLIFLGLIFHYISIGREVELIPPYDFYGRFFFDLRRIFSILGFVVLMPVVVCFGYLKFLLKKENKITVLTQ